MRKLRDGAIALVIVIVMLQFAVAAMQPYFGWIGRTAALVICVLLIAGAVAGVMALLRYLNGRTGGDGDTFNG